MSGQGPTSAPKVRRNVVSPSQKGPMKAVQPFILKSSPNRSPSSPTHWARRSPVHENRLSPDRRSPNSPCFKVPEGPKAVRGSPATSSLRRTSSLDTLGPYLKGQWPAEVAAPSTGFHHTQQPMQDKMTQTPDDWPGEVSTIKSEKKKKKHRRSASFGHGDKKLAKFQMNGRQSSGDIQFDLDLQWSQKTNVYNNTLNSIRQKLQKTKDHMTKQRSSPIPANHNALLQTAPAVLMRSLAIVIPPASNSIPKTSMSRYQRNSVEGLNPEIERMMQMTISGSNDEESYVPDIPDGHRAPVPELRSSGTRSVDTQTPSGVLDDRSCSPPPSPASRPQSISPAIPIMPTTHLENSPRPLSSAGSTPRDTGDCDSISPDINIKSTASPKPNKIVREPPDGCEKIKVFDEDKTSGPFIREQLLCCPIPSHFVLKPSTSSAFCPLKKFYSQGTSFKQTSPITTTTTASPSTAIES